MFNTHLDHIAQLSREKGMALIMSRLSGRKYQDPIILTGDFNSGENNAVVYYLKGERQLDAASNGLSKNPLPLVDTFRLLHKDASDVRTAHGFTGSRSRQQDRLHLRPARHGSASRPKSCTTTRTIATPRTTSRSRPRSTSRIR